MSNETYSKLQGLLRKQATGASTSSRASDDSQDSQSTAATSNNSSIPTSVKHTSNKQRISDHTDFNDASSTTFCPRSSTETYASDQSDLALEQGVKVKDPEFEIPEYKDIVYADLRPSTPHEFGRLFPSSKRLYVRHDDTTYDGNMNLRVDIEAKDGLTQLFYLRMHDLKQRDFSLRRYERASGREVCHSTRIYSKPAGQSTHGLTRSLSNALTCMVKKPDTKRSQSSSTENDKTSSKFSGTKYSGHALMGEGDGESVSSRTDVKALVPTNHLKLEFANYMQIDIRCRNGRFTKRYDFEYWGYTYTWKRVARKDGFGQAISYRLYKVDGGPAVAHIVPELRTSEQNEQDLQASNWVPPCSLWISDMRVVDVNADIAEVIISTGLIVLVDDCINRRFHAKPANHLVKVPLTDLTMDITPRTMMATIFRRSNPNESAPDKQHLKIGSPLKINNIVAAC